MEPAKPLDSSIKLLFHDVEVPFYRVDPLRTQSVVRHDLLLERADLYPGVTYSTGLVEIGAGRVVNRCGHVVIKV